MRRLSRLVKIEYGANGAEVPGAEEVAGLVMG
jgi:hypothetical protein